MLHVAVGVCVCVNVTVVFWRELGGLYCSALMGTASGMPAALATSFSAARFFFLAALRLVEVFNRDKISSFSILFSVLHCSGSKSAPVIFKGPLGIKRTVNLNCATYSPSLS